MSKSSDNNNNNNEKTKLNTIQIGGLIVGVTIVLGSIYYLYKRNKRNKEYNKERTLAIIKPDAFSKREEIKRRIVERGFVITQSTKTRLQKEMAQLFYAEHQNKKFFQELINYITSGPIEVMTLESKNAVQKWRDLMGPTDPNTAKKTHPDSIRAIYGVNLNSNAVHGSDSPSAASRELKFFFDE